MNKNQFRELVQESLTSIGLWSREAEELIMLTAAQESRLGEYIKQIKGPALGVMQMEPATFEDHLHSYLKYKEDLQSAILTVCNMKYFDEQALVFNLKFSIIMARVHYLRKPESLPDYNDLRGIAKYYKKHYNTYSGSAKIEEAMSNYQKYAL
jgi:hypothetical protein